MPLRLKLLVAVIVLVFAGLVVSDLVTYTSLRSFLIQRVDQQLGSGWPLVLREGYHSKAVLTKRLPNESMPSTDSPSRQNIRTPSADLGARLPHSIRVWLFPSEPLPSSTA